MLIDGQDKMDNFWKQLASLAVIGAAIAFAKELRDGKINKNDWSKALGRILLGGGLAISAASLQLYFTTAPFIALVGAGAALVVLGDLFLGKIVDNFMDRMFPKKEDTDGPKL
jgi:hypothetical protein